eukprot:950900-Pleurochrysis_carterae.AAC.6
MSFAQVPGGFGIRAVEGKIAVAKFARENKIPFLGVCLGFQVAVIEYARSVLGYTTAHSAEFDEDTAHKLIVFMPEISRTHMGGTMRLGSRRTVLKTPQCMTARLYNGATAFDERHRHRYEVNIDYVKELEVRKRSRRAPEGAVPPLTRCAHLIRLFRVQSF